MITDFGLCKDVLAYPRIISYTVSVRLPRSAAYRGQYQILQFSTRMLARSQKMSTGHFFNAPPPSVHGLPQTTLRLANASERYFRA